MQAVQNAVLPETKERDRKSWTAPAQSSAPKTPTGDQTPFPDNFVNTMLLERCGKGDQKALHSLLNRYERLIHGLAYRLTGNYDDAGDVAAEAYVRLCSLLGTCRSAAALPSWISRVVFNAFCDLRRRSQRCPTLSLDGMSGDIGDGCLAHLENKAVSPQRYVETQERKHILRKAIATLPAHQQNIIQLFYQDERSYEEISSLMGIAVGTVKARLNRAREGLQQKV